MRACSSSGVWTWRYVLVALVSLPGAQGRRQRPGTAGAGFEARPPAVRSWITAALLRPRTRVGGLGGVDTPGHRSGRRPCRRRGTRLGASRRPGRVGDPPDQPDYAPTASRVAGTSAVGHAIVEADRRLGAPAALGVGLRLVARQIREGEAEDVLGQRL